MRDQPHNTGIRYRYDAIPAVSGSEGVYRRHALICVFRNRYWIELTPVRYLPLAFLSHFLAAGRLLKVL